MSNHSKYSLELNPLEKQVLRGLLQGRKYTVIAQQLMRNESHIRSVTKSLYNKLGAFNKVQALNAALARGYTLEKL